MCSSDLAGRAPWGEGESVVVRRVLLGARQGRPDEGDLPRQPGADQPGEGDVPGGQVPDLVADDEAQRLRVARRAAHLEQVGVDRDAFI